MIHFTLFLLITATFFLESECSFWKKAKTFVKKVVDLPGKVVAKVVDTVKPPKPKVESVTTTKGSPIENLINYDSLSSDLFLSSVDHVSEGMIEAILQSNAANNNCGTELVKSNDVFTFVRTRAIGVRASQTFALTSNVGSLSSAIVTVERHADNTLSVDVSARCATVKVDNPTSTISTDWKRKGTLIKSKKTWSDVRAIARGFDQREIGVLYEFLSCVNDNALEAKSATLSTSDIANQCRQQTKHEL